MNAYYNGDNDTGNDDDGTSKRLLIKDLLNVFENYESSKYLLWEIVRTFHPIHTAALLFCLENVTKSYKANTLTINTEPSNRSSDNINDLGDVRLMEIDESTTKPEPGVVLCCIRPTLRLNRCTYDRENLPNFKNLTNVTDKRDQFGNLTIFGLIEILQTPNAIETNSTCTIYERIVMHNLRTRSYTQFSQNVLHQLLPEHMQQSRHETPAMNNCTMTAFDQNNESSMHVKFLQFYESLYNDPTTESSKRQMMQRESRTFRQINRPRPVQIYEKPANLIDGYYVQPRYVGYNVVINSTKTTTRAYNRYGELLHSVLYLKRFPVHATFEAIIMPLDESGRCRSWRYVRPDNRTGTNASTVPGIMTCQNFIVYVIDVFRIRDKLLVNEPFYRRIRYARLLECQNVYACNTCGGDQAVVLWDTLERQHDTSTAVLDPFAPVNGIMLHGKNDTAVGRHRQYIFSANVIYNFQKNALNRVSGDCSIRLALDAYFSPDMSDRCTAVLVYAHDDKFYYTCRFDRTRFTFVHDTCLDRVCDIWRTRLRYTKETVYVQNAKIVPMGMAVLRVYHNENRDFRNINRDSRRSIIAYETKMTLSMYDVPFKRVRWFH